MEPSDAEVSVVIRKLFTDDFPMTDEEVATLLWITSQDGPDTLEKAKFALALAFEIEHMVLELQRSIREDSRRNPPTFNARLIPLYEQYVASLQDTRMGLFYRACKTLLEDSWIYMDHDTETEPPVDYLNGQLEFMFETDDF